jgi:hypothetical protein
MAADVRKRIVFETVAGRRRGVPFAQVMNVSKLAPENYVSLLEWITVFETV